MKIKNDFFINTDLFSDFGLTPAEEVRIGAISEICKAYKDNSLTLVLGAGISKDCGLLSWNQLIKELFFLSEKQNTVSVQKAKAISELFSAIFKPSPLAMAKFTQKKLSRGKGRNDINFAETVRKMLYEFANQDNSGLIDSLCEFCHSDKHGGKLNAVITYNYDSLIEDAITKLKPQYPKSIYWPKQHCKAEQLPVYHVHGFLPRKGSLTRKHKIVLSEEAYHKQYTDVYNWSNLIQLEHFKNNTCLFVGLSFTDPNMRRLLEISGQHRDPKKKGWHYAIMKMQSYGDIRDKLKKLLEESQEHLNCKQSSGSSFKDMCLTLQKGIKGFYETDLFAFNIKVLWVQDFDEVPKLLNQISCGFRKDADDFEPEPYDLTPVPEEGVTSETIVDWVKENFEDPAEAVPYDGREGGYQFVLGGNHTVYDIVDEYFGEVNEDIREDATQELYGEFGEYVVRKGLY